MPTLDQVRLGASEAQRAIRASRAIRARRDYGLAAGQGNVAAYWQWVARVQRHDGPQRRGLEPLAAGDEALWVTMTAWGLEPCEP